MCGDVPSCARARFLIRTQWSTIILLLSNMIHYSLQHISTQTSLERARNSPFPRAGIQSFSSSVLSWGAVVGKCSPSCAEWSSVEENFRLDLRGEIGQTWMHVFIWPRSFTTCAFCLDLCFTLSVVACIQFSGAYRLCGTVKLYLFLTRAQEMYFKMIRAHFNISKIKLLH